MGAVVARDDKSDVWVSGLRPGVEGDPRRETHDEGDDLVSSPGKAPKRPGETFPKLRGVQPFEMRRGDITERC